MPRRSPLPTLRTLVIAGAGVCLLPIGPAGLAQTADPEPTIRWQRAIGDAATIEIDLPTGWEAIEPAAAGGPTRFRPIDGTPCDVRVEFAPAAIATPPGASADALRALVDGEAQDFLDQAVESRYTLRELRGPEAAGFYFTLRDRAPRRKEAVFLNRGALLVKEAVVRFTIETPKPDLPAIRQALKMLAGSRVRSTAAAPVKPEAAGTPSSSTSASREEPGTLE